MANGKIKGGAFEREVCKALSLWWSGGEDDAIFYRSASSGGRATVRSRKGKATKNSHGDVMAVDSVGQPLIDLVTIEIKRGYNKHTLHDIIDTASSETEWEKWIKQAQESSEGAGSYSWMIIAKRDRRETVVAMPQGLYMDLGSDHNRIILRADIGSVVIERFDSFLAIITPNYIRRLLLKYVPKTDHQKLPVS